MIKVVGFSTAAAALAYFTYTAVKETHKERATRRAWTMYRSTK